LRPDGRPRPRRAPGRGAPSDRSRTAEVLKTRSGRLTVCLTSSTSLATFARCSGSTLSRNHANSVGSRARSRRALSPTGKSRPERPPIHASDRTHDLSALRHAQRGPCLPQRVFCSSLSVRRHSPGRTDRSASTRSSLGISGRARAQLPGARRRRDLDPRPRGALAPGRLLTEKRKFAHGRPVATPELAAGRAQSYQTTLRPSTSTNGRKVIEHTPTEPIKIPSFGAVPVERTSCALRSDAPSLRAGTPGARPTSTPPGAPRPDRPVRKSLALSTWMR
jgi:hypothetical protein